MNRMSRWHFESTDYPAVRRVMEPGQAFLDDAAIEQRLGQLFPETEPGEVEDFMRTLQRFGRQVAPLAQRALPGVVQGAVTGGTVAGPWGAVAGAVGGGAASLLSGGPRAAAAPSSASAPVAPAPAGAAVSPPPAPAQAPSTNAGPDPNAAQLLALLSRPETIQALLALLMSSAGRTSVQVGARQVPPAAFANALAETAARLRDEQSPATLEQGGAFLVEVDGSPRCDPYNPAERARVLAADLAWQGVREALAQDALTEDDERDAEATPFDPIMAYEAELGGPDDE